MKREEIGFNVYGTRELSQTGVSGMVESTKSDGLAIITKYGQPVAMVMPISHIGMQKTYELLVKVMELAPTSISEDFKEISSRAIAFLDKYK